MNLFTLLKARYVKREAKLQLAILFSLISNPALQPTREIRGLLGEVDDSYVGSVELDGIGGPVAGGGAGAGEFWLSSRRGGGYSYSSVEHPPPWGWHIVPPEFDAFGGYTSAPEVSFKQAGDCSNRGD